LTLIVGAASFFLPAIIGLGKETGQEEIDPLKDDEIAATQTPGHSITEMD